MPAAGRPEEGVGDSSVRATTICWSHSTKSFKSALLSTGRRPRVIVVTRG
jgi:hypothetical protein